MNTVSQHALPFRVGVAGIGWVATNRHLPSYKKDKRVTIQAVMAPDQSKADKAAKRFKVPRSFNNIDQLLEEPLHTVSLCTPPQSHAFLIEKALRSGKNVLVEKPMTITAEEGRNLESLAQELGLALCPCHNFLFSRSMAKAQGLIERGEAGDISWAMGIQISSWQRRLPAWFHDLPGGLFFDEATHLLYLMRHFLGELRVEDSWRSGDVGALGQGSERIEARLQGERGNGNLSMWLGAPFSEWLLFLFCSRAVLVVDLFRDLLVHLPPEEAHNSKDVVGEVARGSLQIWRGMASSGIRHLTGRLYYGHDLLVRRFIDSLQDGSEPPVSARDGWTIVGLMEEILHKSSNS